MNRIFKIILYYFIIRLLIKVINTIILGFIEFIVEPSMSVCSDMLELILGPIHLVNKPKNSAENTDTKEDELNQSDIAIACTEMSCSIADANNTDIIASTSSSVTIVEKTDKGTYYLL